MKIAEQKIKIKPLSVNEAYKGRRFKTKKYKEYEQNLVSFLIKKNIDKIDKNQKLKVFFEFGFSSKQADYDNPIKAFQDILQRTLNFNDSMIYAAFIKKTMVKKGDEFVYFKLEKL